MYDLQDIQHRKAVKADQSYLPLLPGCVGISEAKPECESISNFSVIGTFFPVKFDELSPDERCTADNWQRRTFPDTIQRPGPCTGRISRYCSNLAFH